ncbi:MAG: hypothetical protein WB812_00435 [Woeseiaceae bacterium]
MLKAIRSLAPGSRGSTPVGISLNRALAVAVMPRSGLPAVHIRELPTEPAAQIKSLAGVVTELGLRGSPTAITLSPGTYSLLQVDRPAVEDAELVDAARWLIANSLDYPVDEAVIQVFDGPQPNERLRTPMLNVIAAPARSVRELAGTVRRAGLTPERITVAEMAIRELATAASNSDEAVATVFLAGRQGIILVTRNGEIQLSRRLDYGLNSVKPVDVLATGIHGTLPLELRRTIDYFDSHFAAGGIHRILAGPAEQNFMAFMRQASDVIGLPVSALELAADLKPAPSKTPDYGLPEAYFALGGAATLYGDSHEAQIAT